MKKILLALALSTTFAASAQDFVASYESLPGEALNAFVTRTGVSMQEWTDERGFEVCGVIEGYLDGFKLAIYTSWSQLSCKAPASTAVVTYGYTHTHPRAVRGEIRLHQKTREVEGIPRDQQKAPAAGHRFSEGDYRQGQGYLVYQGQVFFQNGKGTESTVPSL